MLPSLLTLGAIRATTPPGMALITPWFSTLPALPPVLKNLFFPARKSLSEMLSDEATSPPTSTREVLPKIMPEGFRRKTCPLDESEPIICDGLWPEIRLSAPAALLGWLKRTAALAPMLKLFQLAISCCDDWFTVIWVPLTPMVALPAVTCPPPGKAPGSSPYAGAPASSMTASRARLFSGDFGTPPFVLTLSETTIHVSLVFDQMTLNILFIISVL